MKQEQLSYVPLALAFRFSIRPGWLKISPTSGVTSRFLLLPRPLPGLHCVRSTYAPWRQSAAPPRAVRLRAQLAHQSPAGARARSRPAAGAVGGVSALPRPEARRRRLIGPRRKTDKKKKDKMFRWVVCLPAAGRECVFGVWCSEFQSFSQLSCACVWECECVCFCRGENNVVKYKMQLCKLYLFIYLFIILDYNVTFWLIYWFFSALLWLNVHWRPQTFVY